MTDSMDGDVLPAVEFQAIQKCRACLYCRMPAMVITGEWSIVRLVREQDYFSLRGSPIKFANP